jgi:hypothetical protein
MIATLQKRVKEQAEEIKELKKQLEMTSSLLPARQREAVPLASLASLSSPVNPDEQADPRYRPT